MSTQQVRLPPAIRERALRAAIIALVALALAGCNGAKNAYVAPPPPKVVVAQPIAAAGDRLSQSHGQHRAVQRRRPVRRASRAISTIDYVDGASVKKGDQLFGIERSVYQAQLDQAKATVASDQAAQAYNEAEYSARPRSPRMISPARPRCRVRRPRPTRPPPHVLGGRASIETWPNQSRLYQGGRALRRRRHQSSGHIGRAGRRFGRRPSSRPSSRLDPLYVYFTMSEPQILELQAKPRQSGRRPADHRTSDVPVEIALQGEDGFPHTGHLDYASPQVDAATGTLTARAVFDNKNGALLPGLFVRVRTPDRPAGQGAAGARSGDRNQPGGALSIGCGAGQRRPAQDRQDRRTRGALPDHRIRDRSRRLGRDRRRPARNPRREGRSASRRSSSADAADKAAEPSAAAKPATPAPAK